MELNPNGILFLSVPLNFALTLNIDWFQPFKHTNHSTGAMYLVTKNLPRHERYSSENVLLVGVIPGPHKPSKTINDYLKPLVDDLLQLWQGVVMQSDSKTDVMVRAALLCTACDIPASRKVSGFVGHNSLHGCSKCPFRLLVLEKSLIILDLIAHYGISLSTCKSCETAQQQTSSEKEYGCRYSVLLELPYYDGSAHAQDLKRLLFDSSVLKPFFA